MGALACYQIQVYKVTEQYLEAISQYINKMPSLSTTVTKVLEVCNRQDVSPNDLNKIISLDPVLAGNVLKLINSAYYALPNQITSLTRAIIILGINTVKNLALSTAIMGALKGQDSEHLSMDRFWAHSICVGVTAKKLAILNKIPVSQREEYFLAGLLHDLGKVPMAHCFSEQYGQCLKLCKLDYIELHEAEQRIFGFNHAVCGEMIAAKWKLNDAIISVMKYHHEPEKADKDHRLLISSVAIADLYANIFEIGSAGNQCITDMQYKSIPELSTVWAELVQQNDAIQDSIEKASIFMRVN